MDIVVTVLNTSNNTDDITLDLLLHVISLFSLDGIC